MIQFPTLFLLFPSFWVWFWSFLVMLQCSIQMSSRGLKPPASYRGTYKCTSCDL